MKLQAKILKFLQGRFAHYFVLFFISISIIAIIASSFQEMAPFRVYLFAITYVSSFIFLVEFIARIFSAPALFPDKKAVVSRLKYTFSFYGFVDFVAVWPCVLTYLYWDTQVVNVVILPYIFIMFKLLRHSTSFKIIGLALVAVKDELITAYTACLIVVSFSAIVMYYIERAAQPEVFKNIGDGIWWAVVAFTTTGYGDIYPVTMLGKFLGCFISLIGIAVITIPTGIISSSFINIIQERQKQFRNEMKKIDKSEIDKKV